MFYLKTKLILFSHKFNYFINFVVLNKNLSTASVFFFRFIPCIFLAVLFSFVIKHLAFFLIDFFVTNPHFFIFFLCYFIFWFVYINFISILRFLIFCGVWVRIYLERYFYLYPYSLFFELYPGIRDIKKIIETGMLNGVAYPHKKLMYLVIFAANCWPFILLYIYISMMTWSWPILWRELAKQPVTEFYDLMCNCIISWLF